MTSINYLHQEHIHNTKSANVVLPYIFNLIKPTNVIDIGCGTGSWLSVAKQLGAANVLGVDGIFTGTNMLCIEESEFKEHDLRSPLNLTTHYDLAICLEVAEHLPEIAADNLIDVLTAHSDIILFSAAIPGQGGQFHVNEQWPEYWQRKFAEKGYITFDILRNRFWNNEDVDWWYKQNMFIYAKPQKSHLLKAEIDSKVQISYVHPLLFQLKVQNEQKQMQLIKDRIWNPKFYPSLKLLLKSIIKRKIH
ncbi:MAG: hypothetical protein JWN56_1409 [Sphingobacteriales bacterium]|nr:hypothetical protein [Sphingobacteriales bacterium]